MISDRGCLEFAKQFLIKKGRVNISLISVPMVRALVHSLSLAPAIRGGYPFFLREREYGMDRYARFGPTDRDKRATTVATDSSSPLFCSFVELGYC